MSQKKSPSVAIVEYRSVAGITAIAHVAPQFLDALEWCRKNSDYQPHDLSDPWYFAVSAWTVAPHGEHSHEVGPTKFLDWNGIMTHQNMPPLFGYEANGNPIGYPVPEGPGR